MSAPLLQLDGVHTHIGAYHILHGVDLEVARGELTVLLGRNGAGKMSSAFKLAFVPTATKFGVSIIP